MLVSHNSMFIFLHIYHLADTIFIIMICNSYEPMIILNSHSYAALISLYNLVDQIVISLSVVSYEPFFIYIPTK